MEPDLEEFMKTLTSMTAPSNFAKCCPATEPKNRDQVKGLVLKHIYGLLNEPELSDSQIKLLDVLNKLLSVTSK